MGAQEDLGPYQKLSNKQAASWMQLLKDEMQISNCCVGG